MFLDQGGTQFQGSASPMQVIFAHLIITWLALGNMLCFGLGGFFLQHNVYAFDPLLACTGLRLLSNSC